MSRHVLLLTLAMIASAVLGVALAGGAAAKPRAHAARAVFGPAVVHEIDRVRAQHHLPPVHLDRRMSGAAHAHSRDMARHDYFAHGAWSGRVARSARRAHTIGEVLGWLERARPRREAREIVNAWMHSPEHRYALLDGHFRRVGIGRVAAEFGGTRAAIYTVDFASAR